MLAKQIVIKSKDLDTLNLTEVLAIKPQLAFIFASLEVFENTAFVKKLISLDPEVKWVGCSTAGEVSQKGVSDDSIVLTGLHFENPNAKFKIATSKIAFAEASDKGGEKLAQALVAPDLRNILLISPGMNVNGSLLVQGITGVLGPKVMVTGGMAGDGAKFQATYTLSPEGVSQDQVVGIGFYGDSVQVSYGCRSGWDPFGKTRHVTKSIQNVVYELDGQPALNVYKEYLGDHAKNLPGSAMMFPFGILSNNQDESGLIRSILDANEKTGTITFAGDIPQGCQIRLMHANSVGLTEGAKAAAEQAVEKGKAASAFAMVVSCVGRKVVMGPNVDDEIEALSEVFGESCIMGGFYSYGEVSPSTGKGCELHNQTMTISYISEK